MTTTTSNDRRIKVLSPLQFELICDQKNVYESLILLRRIAADKFDKVTKIFRLYDDECTPKQDDPLLEAKIQGVGLLVKLNRIITLQPRSIIGFAFLMPNKRPGYIALATYEDTVEMRDGMVVETSLRGRAAWCGIIETFKTPSPDDCDQEVCSESHKKAIELLDEANNLEILKDIYDATGYWTDRDEDKLKEVTDLFVKGEVSCILPTEAA